MCVRIVWWMAHNLDEILSTTFFHSSALKCSNQHLWFFQKRTISALYSFTSLLEDAAKKDFFKNLSYQGKKSIQVCSFYIIMPFKIICNKWFIAFLSFEFIFPCFSVSNNKKLSSISTLAFLKNSFLLANVIDECVTDGWIMKFRRIQFWCEYMWCNIDTKAKLNLHVFKSQKHKNTFSWWLLILKHLQNWKKNKSDNNKRFWKTIILQTSISKYHFSIIKLKAPISEELNPKFTQIGIVIWCKSNNSKNKLKLCMPIFSS